MAIELANLSEAVCNGTDLSKIVCNGVEVWSKPSSINYLSIDFDELFACAVPVDAFEGTCDFMEATEQSAAMFRMSGLPASISEHDGNDCLFCMSGENSNPSVFLDWFYGAVTQTSAYADADGNASKVRVRVAVVADSGSDPRIQVCKDVMQASLEARNDPKLEFSAATLSVWDQETFLTLLNAEYDGEFPAIFLNFSGTDSVRLALRTRVESSAGPVLLWDDPEMNEDPRPDYEVNMNMFPQVMVLTSFVAQLLNLSSKCGVISASDVAPQDGDFEFALFSAFSEECMAQGLELVSEELVTYENEGLQTLKDSGAEIVVILSPDLAGYQSIAEQADAMGYLPTFVWWNPWGSAFAYDSTADFASDWNDAYGLTGLTLERI